MIATVVNVAAILLGSAIGLLFKSKIKKRFLDLVMKALGLCVAAIGITSFIGTQDMLGMILCMAIGALLGEALRIEDRLDSLGNKLRERVAKRGDTTGFTDAFVNASLLYCVGSMAIMGSLEAGVNQDYTILFSKSVIDGITSITFAATMGYGVLFSVLPLFVYQGAITLLAKWVAPFLSTAVITEMSAVGGLVVFALSINMLGLGKEKISVGNLLPCMLLPIIYQPLSAFLQNLF